MRIAVFSDTHGAFHGLAEMKSRLGKVDWLLHAGDFLADARRVAFALEVPQNRVRAVAGNCDYGVDGPDEAVVAVGGVRILLTHGHQHDVKRGLGRILQRARELDVQAAVFGHSHVVCNQEVQGVLLFNPGSLTFPRGREAGSCGLLAVEGAKITGSLLWQHPRQVHV